MLPPRSPGMAKVASVVREKTKKPTAASAVAPAAGTVPGMLGPASLDANRDAWANALSTMSGVNTPDPITAIAKVAGMGLAGYGQGKATKAKEAGSSAYRAKLAEALSGQPGNADLMGLMADPYADDASQRMLWNLYERNNPTQDELQQRQLRDLQMQQAQLGMQQQQDEAARQQAIRGGQMDAVTGFMQQHEAAGGDLFSPEMQAGLRAQGVQGVDPADTRRYDAMQPYAQAGDYANAFEQYAAQPAAGEGYTLGEGQIRYDGQNRPVAAGPGKSPEPPKRVTVRRGNKEVTQEWNAEAGRYEDVAEGDAFKTTPDVVVNDGMKLTEGQSKDVGFYSRGIYANSDLSQSEDALLSVAEANGGALPLIGNYLKTPAYRQAERAGREFLAVVLRKDTGAAVTQQEFDLYGPMYLPVPGDDIGTLQSKRIARERVMEAIRLGGGTAKPLFEDIDEQFSQRPPPALPGSANQSQTDGMEIDGFVIKKVK